MTYEWPIRGGLQVERIDRGKLRLTHFLTYSGTKFETKEVQGTVLLITKDNVLSIPVN